MKTIYVCRMSENWNCDYLTAFNTLEKVVNEIFERAEEDEDIFPMIEKKELIENMKQRENNGYIELFDPDDIDEELKQFQKLTGFSIQLTTLN